jgi:peptide/nickel transport system substrate-binding protein
MRLNSILKHAISRTATIIVVVVIIIVIAGAGYYALTLHPSTTTTTTTTSSSSTTGTGTISTTSSSSTSASTNTTIPSSISVDEIPGPASVDPGSSYDVSGGEIMQNVYQTLVFYNGSGVNTFVGILAKNWTASSNGMSYTFNLWPFETFSNGDQLNASTIWFSLYRTVLMNEGFTHYTAQYLDLQTAGISAVGGGGFKGNLTDPGSSIAKETIRLPNGTEQALASAGYTFSTNQTTAYEQATNDLLQILNNFNAGNSTIQSVMAFPAQAVSVSGTDQVTLNLMFPFSDFYQTLSATDDSAVDPAFVDAHGGVAVDSANTYVAANALGSGPYMLVDPNGVANAAFVKLVASTNYWATKIPSGQSNPWLVSPSIGTVVINYQDAVSVRISDIIGNNVQFSTVDVPDLPQLSGHSNVVIHNLGATATVDFVSIDAYQYPYNFTGVRQAIAYGINATEIQQDVYSGYAVPYNGPLDPDMAYYNSTAPSNAFNPNLAVADLASTGFSFTLPNGTVYNSGGPALPILSLVYVAGNAAEQEESNIIQEQLGNVGLRVVPTPTYEATIIADQEQGTTTAGASSPTYPGLQLNGNTPVFIGPTDPVTYMTNCAARCGNGDPAELNTTAIQQLNAAVAETSNPTLLQADYNNLTSLVRQSYQYVWLDDFTDYVVSSSSMSGIYWNVALDGLFYATVT